MATWKRSGKKAKSGRKRPRAIGAATLRSSGEGRRTLRVLQDDASGRQRVELTRPLFTESWQNGLTANMAESALLELQGGVDKAKVLQVAERALNSTSKLTDGMLALAENGQVACKAGCAHCCYQSVGVTPPEALLIVGYLQQTLSSQRLAELKVHLEQVVEGNRGLEASQRFSPKHPCAFLEESSGRCTIYPVRPLSCRGMNALDEEACRRSLREPEARQRFLKTGEGPQCFLEPIRAFHAVSAGLQLGLSELFGLDMRPLDLAAAALQLLTAPPSLVADWLSGKSALEAVRGGDSSNRQEIRGLSGLVPDHS